MRRVPSRQKNLIVRRQGDPEALVRLGLLLLGGLLLAGGFVFAAGQHFAALHTGYQSENLRRERERLLEDRRKLLLEREEAAAPARLERAARELGMQAVQPAQIDLPKDSKEISPEKGSPAVAPATVNSSASTATGAGTN